MCLLQFKHSRGLIFILALVSVRTLVLNRLHLEFLFLQIRDNIDLLCKARDNILSILNEYVITTYFIQIFSGSYYDENALVIEDKENCNAECGVCGIVVF